MITTDFVIFKFFAGIFYSMPLTVLIVFVIPSCLYLLFIFAADLGFMIYQVFEAKLKFIHPAHAHEFPIISILCFQELFFKVFIRIFYGLHEFQINSYFSTLS